MASLDEIADQVKSGTLIEVPLRRLRIPDYRRYIYVSPEIDKELRDRSDEPCFRKLSAQFQNFITGQDVPVIITPPPHKKAEWARLQPPGDEIWESRVLAVTPQLRVVGRFAAKDCFVAFNLYDYELKGKKAWNPAKARCQADWDRIFPKISPVFGLSIHDYLTTNFTII